MGRVRDGKLHGNNTKFLSFIRYNRKCSAKGFIVVSGVKFTYLEVSDFFDSKNWKLVSSEYHGSAKLLDFICDKGHYHQISVNKLLSGKGCGKCYKNKKHTLSEVRQLFSDRGFTLLSKRYKNLNDNLDFICDKDHSHQMSLDSLIRGVECGKCFAESINNVPYKIYQLYSYIYSKIDIQIVKIGKRWFDFYSESFILEIAESILPFYLSCKKGKVVDHFVPCKWFNLTDKDELLSCWSIENLQYLTPSENSIKSDRMTEEELYHAIDNFPHILRSASRIPDKYLRLAREDVNWNN